MELGALVCLPQPARPLCASCPLNFACAAHLLGETEKFPEKKTKKVPLLQEISLALVVSGGCVWTRRRTGTPLRGMVEFPCCEGDITPLLAELGVPEGVLVGEYTHVFTHRRWRVRCYVCSGEGVGVPAGYTEQPIGEMEKLGLPAAFRKAVVFLEEKP